MWSAWLGTTVAFLGVVPMATEWVRYRVSSSSGFPGIYWSGVSSMVGVTRHSSIKWSASFSSHDSTKLREKWNIPWLSNHSRNHITILLCKIKLTFKQSKTLWCPLKETCPQCPGLVRACNALTRLIAPSANTSSVLRPKQCYYSLSDL